MSMVEIARTEDRPAPPMLVHVKRTGMYGDSTTGAEVSDKVLGHVTYRCTGCKALQVTGTSSPAPTSCGKCGAGAPKAGR